MPNLIIVLIVCQALGAILGAVGAVWSEVAYVHAMRDGEVDSAERRHLAHLARGLRFGMTLLLVSSLGLVIAAYMRGASVQPALTASYWMLILLALVVVYVSWALSRSKISFALGSAIAFTGWWFLVYLTLGLLPALTFGGAVAFYVVAAGIFYAILHYARFISIPTHSHTHA